MKKAIIIFIISIFILILAVFIKKFYKENKDINIEKEEVNDIISSTIAIEHGILDIGNSTKVWSGEKFWNESWNKNINFIEAFQTSCVWYFRELIDEMGKDLIQIELNKLKYGNCDITDWNGKQNTNNNNPALTGFWIESSLKISPKEQVEVMEHIFGDISEYSEDTKKQLEQVMFVDNTTNSDILIYGKTGMGKDRGIIVDSWFVGFADIKERGRIYFSIYLGENNKNAASTKAKEIAINVINGLFSDNRGLKLAKVYYL